ncbi:Zn-ribbon domain-containing OB-fold protein [Rhodococcus sp. Leaf278]|uniref:Zn-ribbon domain-containing OB-fold protein n=1 Tax=Rhodococcus sp. Leaf278 TaxID=1736319 RepID=UPI000A8D1CE5|nr:OB-fold domain-containing protein [Rhodococcus sp. Leaf278]
MQASVPIVNYLTLDGDEAYLLATDCSSCGASYLGSRIACSRCSSRTFVERRLPNDGTVGSFSIVHRAPAPIVTPFVSALIDLSDGTTVKANIIDCPPDADHVRLGMSTVMRTYEVGRDSEGTIAMAFGFAPNDAATEGDTAAPATKEPR